jgi:hypothetical protein
MIKVRIKKQAKAKTGYQVDGALANDIAPMGGADYNKNTSAPKLRESRYITADPREEANVEAEGGEIVYGDINGDFFPEAQIIKGPRHAQGGVPLNLPEDTFIFSDTRSMRIKDCEILKMFGKPCGKNSYTPAELAKQYDIQKYRLILEDPDSNAVERKTAELMIKNYVVKLGCLALKQESMKGFPQGIPVVARPCMEAKGITDEDVLPSKELEVLKDQLQKQKEQEQAQSQGGNENMLNEAMGMNQGRPVAEPQPMQQPPQQIQPAPQPMMQDGGGYSDVYKQQMQQQQAAEQQMMQLAQQVQSALEQGAAPEQVIQALLYDQIPPETIVGIFTQLGASQEEVVGLIEQSMAAAQQQQQQPQQPMAKYGMTMMPWGGEVEVKEEDYAGDTAAFQEALRRAYAQVGPKGTVYVVKSDGKRYRQNISATGHTEYTGSDLASGWNNNQVAAATYMAMKQTFENDDAKKVFANEVRTALKDKENYKGKGGGYSDMFDAKFSKNPDDLTDDEIVNQYLRMQERNLKTTTMGAKAFAGLSPRADGKEYPFGSWMYKDKNGKLRKKTGSGTGDDLGFVEAVMQADPGITRAEAESMYDALNVNDYQSLKKISSNMGLPMEFGTDTEEAYLQQASFIAADKLMKKLDADDGTAFTDDERYALLGITSFAGFNPYGKQVGFSDETGMGTINISPIDGYYTNTTQGEIQAHHGLKFEDFVPEDCQCDDPNAPNYSPYKDAEGNCTCDPPTEVKKCPCQYPDGRVIEMTPDPTTGDCPPCEEDVSIETPGGYAPWWLQDTIKTTGAFGDLMGLKKYMPWAPGVDLEEPRPTFLDPTRELAANAEQANIQTQGMAQFAGPQALSARSSGIQGQAAKNAADVLAKYNNANVNIANQFELKATDIRNQESMLRQATNQRLYDQNTVANQQFDNAKLAMRNNLRNQYTNAITNRWKTDAMNQMYPDYAVDPSVGGQMHHTPNYRKPTPTSGGMTMQEAMDWCKKNNPAAKDHSACMQRVMNAQKGNTATTPAMPPNMYPGFKKGGQVGAGYVYFNPWFNDDM